jgi:hypothetical protein
MARSSPRPSMACSFCAPQSRAGGAMVAQELDQLVSTVLERSTKAMVATKFLGPRLRPTAPSRSGTWPWHLRACLCDFQEGMPATTPRADRGRANAGETAEYIDLGASGLAPSYLASPVGIGIGYAVCEAYSACLR